MWCTFRLPLTYLSFHYAYYLYIYTKYALYAAFYAKNRKDSPSGSFVNYSFAVFCFFFIRISTTTAPAMIPIAAMPTMIQITASPGFSSATLL